MIHAGFEVPQEAQVLFNTDDWLNVNDDVMGGMSRSQMRSECEGLVFSGFVSLENNGGFVSTRTAVCESVGGILDFRLVVRGDGRRYQFRLRQDERLAGIAWRRSFNTNGDDQVLDFLLDEFEPVYRGRPVSVAGALEGPTIKQMGFMLADKRQGAFELLIRRIDPITGC